MKAGMGQLSGVTVASRGIALQCPSGGSEQAGAQLAFIQPWLSPYLTEGQRSAKPELPTQAEEQAGT